MPKNIIKNKIKTPRRNVTNKSERNLKIIKSIQVEKEKLFFRISQKTEENSCFDKSHFRLQVFDCDESDNTNKIDTKFKAFCNFLFLKYKLFSNFVDLKQIFKTKNQFQKYDTIATLLF